MDNIWESDLHLLKTTATLAEKTPRAFLYEICRKTGDNISLRDVEEGIDLPVMVKKEIQNSFDSSLRKEREIIDQCCRQSSQFGKILFFFSALAIVLASLFVL